MASPSTRPSAATRRIYIGPINPTAFSDVAALRRRPPSSFLSSLLSPLSNRSHVSYPTRPIPYAVAVASASSRPRPVREAVTGFCTVRVAPSARAESRCRRYAYSVRELTLLLPLQAHQGRWSATRYLSIDFASPLTERLVSSSLLRVLLSSR